MLRYRLASLLILALFIGLWQGLVWAKIIELIPAPFEIILALIELFKNGVLVAAIFDSLLRFFAGFLIGAVLGVVLGLILGRFARLEILLDPFLQFAKPLSPLALFPIIVLMLGIGEFAAIFIIAYSVFFPILFLCINGVRNIPKQRFLMARNFGANEGLIFYHIVIPGAFLSIANGLKLAASIAFIQLVAAEMLGVQSGLGYIIIDGRNLLRIDYIFVGIFMISSFGFLINLIFASLEKLIKKRLGKL